MRLHRENRACLEASGVLFYPTIIQHLSWSCYLTQGGKFVKVPGRLRNEGSHCIHCIANNLNVTRTKQLKTIRSLSKPVMNKCTKLLLRKPETIRHFRCLSTRTKQSPAEYCLDLVRKHDYESFLCTLLLPQNLRSAAFVVRAFNVEVALVEDQVSDNTIGRMRYKFWEDALDKVYGDTPPRSPVPLELHRVLKTQTLSKRYFKRLINARLEKLGVSMFPDLEALEKYSENSSSSIYYLLLEANGTKDVHVDHVASHLGKAHGIVNLIRSVAHHARKRNCVLPQDILIKHDVPMESIFRGETSKGLSDVIFEVSSRAKLHLDKARSLKDSSKKETATIFLPGTIVNIYLDKLQRADFNIFSSILHTKNNLLPLQLYWKKLTKKPY